MLVCESNTVIKLCNQTGHSSIWMLRNETNIIDTLNSVSLFCKQSLFIYVQIKIMCFIGHRMSNIVFNIIILIIIIDASETENNIAMA